MSRILDPRQGDKRRAVPAQDFTAVILCGQGENLYPFNQGTNVLPKALVPVGNVPIINLVLDWVFASGLTDILIISPPNDRDAIGEHIQQAYSQSSHPRARITLRDYKDGEDEDGDGSEFSNGDDRVGTARLLRRFRSHIKSDFILLPCDISFPSKLTLASLLDKHRATPNAVVTSVFYEPTEAVMESEDKLLVATDKESSELLLVQPLETIEEELELRTQLLQAHPTLSLSTRLLDAHVYIFRRTVLDLLATRRPRELSSVKEQFVPWLVKGTWQEGLGHQWSNILCPPTRDPFAEALARSTATPWDVAASLMPPSEPPSAGSEREHTPLPDAASSGEQLVSFKKAVNRKKSSQRKREPVPWTCRVVIARPETPPAPAVPVQKGKGAKSTPAPEGEHIIRANSLAGYWDLSRRLIRQQAPTGPINPRAPAMANTGAATGAAPSAAVAAEEISSTAQISPDSLIGEGVRVGDRASIKKCVVGRHCNIGRGAKLTGCVLWDWVTVEENARLENVVLCPHVRIGAKAQVSASELGPGFEAQPEAVIKNERLVAGQEA